MRISVIGCGYLGAVHAAAMAELGHDVVGIDVDEGEEGEGADEDRAEEERGGHTMKGWLAWWWSGTIEGRGKGMKEPTPPGDDGDGRIAVADVEGSIFILMFL